MVADIGSMVRGFTNELLFARDIPSLYRVLTNKIDEISERIGFDEIAIHVCTDEDNNLVPANPDLSNVSQLVRVYSTTFTGEVMADLLDKPFDPESIANDEFMIPYQTNEVFEMPRSEKKIKALISAGVLHPNILDNISNDYESVYVPRMKKSGKIPTTPEMHRGGIHVPLLIDGGFNYGQINFSVFNQDPEKYPDLAKLTLEDDIPDKYKDMIKEITSEFSPIIFNILKLHKEHKLRTAAEQAKKETEAKNQELKQAYSDLEVSTAALIEQEKKTAEQKARAAREEATRAIAEGVLHDIGNLVNRVDSSVRFGMTDVYDEYADFSKIFEELKTVPEGKFKSKFEELMSHDFWDVLKDGASSVPLVRDNLLAINHLLKSIRTDYEFSFKDVYFSQLVESEVSDLEPTMKSMTISRNYLTDPVKINVDPIHVGRVIGNIVKNAYEAMISKPDGKLIITESMAGPEKVKMSFHDNGQGIPDHMKPKIFQLYTTSNVVNSDSRKRGLGLYTSKKLVEAHKDARLYFDSQLGKGTTFNLEFPVSV